MSLKGTVWAPIGPSPITQGANPVNGLVSAIAVHPANPNVIYIGTAGGGAWRSVDGGASWFPLFDRQLSLAVGEPGALAIDPNNTDVVYLGTSARVAAQPQAGLFKSTDGGASWILLGLGYPSGNTGNALQFILQWINVIIVDPADSNTLYLASTSGCFRSIDGGRNWTAGVNAGGDARSLVLDRSTPAGARILYAGISGRGVFRSNDGGQNWTQLLSAATPAVAAAVGAAPASFRKAIVGLAPPSSPPNPGGVQVLYATLEGTGGAPDPVGVFLSTDQGANWTQRTATGMPTGTQGGYSFHMAVDPGSPGDGANDIIYFGAVGHARSIDSGNTFTALAGLHADNHSWAFFPQPSPTPSTVFCGNDGGLYRSIDGGATWTPLSAGGLQTGLFYNLDMRPDATGSNNVGALQDNGTQTRVGATGRGWVAAQGGDGWDVVYDGTIAGRVYCTSGFWSPAPCTRIWRSTDDGASFPTEITPWGTASDAGCYLGPLATDPSAGGILYASGSQNLWQSRDGGGTWRILSPFTGTGDVDVARTNGNHVVIGVGNRVFVSTNALAATVGPPAGVTFTDITRNLPPRTVARVAFDPNDPTMIYVVLGGLNGGPGNIGHVFRTSVGATVWTDISPNLNIPFNAIALDGTDNPTTIYAGTDFGVLRSVDGGASWSVLDDIHFPRVPVQDLVLRNGMLRAATYGRGAFEFVRPKGPSIAVNLEKGLAFGTVCLGPHFVSLEIFNVGKSDLVINSVQRLMGSTSFSVLSTPGTPLVIAAGEHVNFTVKYDPTAAGATEIATIRIVSNDPDAPIVDLAATGRRGTATMATAIANAGSFGSVCLGSFVDRKLTINNSGHCPLQVLNITSSAAEFVTPSVAVYPLVVAPGDSLALPIRFQPTSYGAKAASITLISNDPASPRIVTVSGNVPSGKLAVTGSTCIGGVQACCLGERIISICNVGDCELHVTSVAFKRKSKHWKLINNPFPATLHPGSCLSVLIRYKATEKCPKGCELVITSDDPITPVKNLDVIAYTIWSDGREKNGCDDCRNGCCEKHHAPCCSAQSLDPCCADEGNEHKHEDKDEDEDEG
jgi:hypothetical protein